MSIDAIQRFYESGRPEALMHAVATQLAGDNPSGYVLHTDEPLFDPLGFLRSLGVHVDRVEAPHPLFTYHWSRPLWRPGQDEPTHVRSEDALRPALASGRFRFTWEGERFDFVGLIVPMVVRDRNERWLSAPSQEAAERFFDAVCAHHAEIRAEILVYKNGCWQKDAALYAEVRRSSLDDLVLPDGMVSRVRDDFRRFLDSQAFYAQHRIPYKRGALFLGPPGNGKTLCIKGLIGELDVPCLYVQSFVAPHVPMQQCIGEVFARARRSTPCLLVLEDLDSLVTGEALSFFLNELDGFAANEGLITLASTNHAERLDPALLHRPSRFDRKYHFGLPGPSEREAYVARWSEALAAPMQLDVATQEKLVAHTDGFSYAYLKELFLGALMRWSADPEQAFVDVALDEARELAAQRESVTSP
ncbi:MAG: ATP-binding protein [Sandaracinaceae bacterium]|nr:MAG: AAA family ATPase [Sandaracinaceae bacterium]